LVQERNAHRARKALETSTGPRWKGKVAGGVSPNAPGPGKKKKLWRDRDQADPRDPRPFESKPRLQKKIKKAVNKERMTGMSGKGHWKTGKEKGARNWSKERERGNLVRRLGRREKSGRGERN